MSDDTGIITIYLPIASGRRATRVKLPGDCTLIDAAIGPVRTVRKYANTGPKPGRPQVQLRFRLSERYPEPVERLFRVIDAAHAADILPGLARSLGTIAQVDCGKTLLEIIEVASTCANPRTSDIRTHLMARGLNRLVFRDARVVRVNGVAVARHQPLHRRSGVYQWPDGSQEMIGGRRRRWQAGAHSLIWELRYQMQRHSHDTVGWSYIGTDEDESRGLIPASLAVWPTEMRAESHARRDLKIWLSANLLSVARG